MFDFRRITLFCFGYRLSKHKMTICPEKWGEHAPLALLATTMAQATKYLKQPVAHSVCCVLKLQGGSICSKLPLSSGVSRVWHMPWGAQKMLGKN